jgi:hypothetical protein
MKKPMFTGARCEPVLPVTEGYARGVLLIYYPWHGRSMFDTKASGLLIFSKNGLKTKIGVQKLYKWGMKEQND